MADFSVAPNPPNPPNPPHVRISIQTVGIRGPSSQNPIDRLTPNLRQQRARAYEIRRTAHCLFGATLYSGVTATGSLITGLLTKTDTTIIIGGVTLATTFALSLTTLYCNSKAEGAAASFAASLAASEAQSRTRQSDVEDNERV